MKKRTALIVVSLIALTVGVISIIRLEAADEPLRTFDYAILHYDGMERTHLIRGNGQVEMLSPLFHKNQRPDKVDTRAYVLAIALGAVARQGFEVVAVADDSVYLKRPLVQE